MATNATSTQQFVPVKEVRDGVIILKNGELRAIVLASALNIALKSQEEQEAVLFQFQSFLNSLDFSTQIVIQSRRLDIRPYLLQLEKKYDEQDEPLLKIQTREYIDFIKDFTENVSIMTKSFFIVVSYGGNTFNSGAEGVLKNILGDSKKNTQQELLNFEESRAQLDQRVSTVQQGLARLGVRCVQLGTEEIVEVLYKTFNPGETHEAVDVS